MAWSNWRQAVIWINFDPVFGTPICLLEKDSSIAWTQYWRIINEVLWHSYGGYFIRYVQVFNHWMHLKIVHGHVLWYMWYSCFCKLCIVDNLISNELVKSIDQHLSNNSTACFPLKVAVARFHYLISTWNMGHVPDIVYDVYAQCRILCFMPISAYYIYARYYTYYMLYIAYHVLKHIVMTWNYISNTCVIIGPNCKLRSLVSGFDLIWLPKWLFRFKGEIKSKICQHYVIASWVFNRQITIHANNWPADHSSFFLNIVSVNMP